jgi:glycosyltransferase involved in cell wall biosynthesis
MEFSVVIATKDRQGYLQRAVASLVDQIAPFPFEIIVVDNGSIDATRRVVEAFANGAVAVRYVAEAQPNRAKARNSGVAIAAGRYVAFCDDDVLVPQGWIVAHAAAQNGGDHVVNGPIINVASYSARPAPRAVNFSRAFLCSCNVSLSRRAFREIGGFDESFNLYGWEDTELGLRLRRSGSAWKFAWDAYLWHVKPGEPAELAVESRKAIEKARMAALFVAKHPSSRARLATGAHPLNLLRGRYLLPEWLLAIYAGLSSSRRLPAWATAIARTQLLDGLYTRELVRTIDREREG